MELTARGARPVVAVLLGAAFALLGLAVSYAVAISIDPRLFASAMGVGLLLLMVLGATLALTGHLQIGVAIFVTSPLVCVIGLLALSDAIGTTPV